MVFNKLSTIANRVFNNNISMFIVMRHYILLWI